MKWRGGITVALLLAIVAVCILGYVLNSQSSVFREFQAVLLSVQWMLLVCLAVWCGAFIFLTFSLNDLPVIGLLLIAIILYFIGNAVSWREPDVTILLAGVTLGRGARLLLMADGRWHRAEVGSQKSDGGSVFSLRSPTSGFRIILVGLVVSLAGSAWWHLDATGAYHGQRWMGLWDNPNIYGMLMGAGLVLAAGLLVENRRRRSDESHFENQKSVRDSLCRLLPIILFIAAGMMGVGLLFSYSRGAWLGTAVSLLYLAKAHGKLKWRYVMLGAGLMALGILCLWGRTPDNAPWYLKRLDFSRPSAQHRVSAWHGAFQMMRDHPLGVGWNKAIETYDKNYSPPEGGAAAITMNSYLMLGTELGLPGLLCFVVYVALCFRSPRPKVQSPKSGNGAALDTGHRTSDSLRAACLAGALVFVVAFWFDGGLFDLPTASVFWILLELGKHSSI